MKQVHQETEIGINRLLGQYVRKARESAGLSQAVLAQHIGISADQIAALEMGTERITPHQHTQIADALDIHVSDLFPPPIHLVENQNLHGEEDIRAMRNEIIALTQQITDAHQLHAALTVLRLLAH